MGKVKRETEISAACSVSKYNQIKKKRKEERKRKIITLFREKNRITNDDVEDLLGISHSSATNYLQELEDEGKIRQIGKAGCFVHYKINNQ